MYFAHLPASYLLSRALLTLPGCARQSQTQRRRLLAIGTLAGSLPDFDVPFSYFATDHGINHRALPSHWPLSWLLIFSLLALAAHIHGRREWQWHNFFLLAGVQLHFVLDTIAGPIRWLSPFQHTRFSLYQAPKPGYGSIWSHAIHFSAGMEIALIVAAIGLIWRTSAQARS